MSKLPPSGAPSLRSSFAAWIRLLRLPNLVTVPGDPLAGYLLAAGPAASFGRPLALALSISLLLYASGLIMNDILDQRVDAAERPRRPLPAGLIDDLVARLVTVTLIAIALLLARYLGWAQIIVALALLGCLTLYNAVLKRTAIGPLAMGLCRGLSLLLGASLAGRGSPLVWGAAVGLVAYVAAVTVVARREMANRVPSWWSVLPAASVLVIASILLRLAVVDPTLQGRLGTVLFLAFALSGLGAWRLHAGGPRATPDVIGIWISALLVVQAACCIASGGGAPSLFAGLALLLLWPINRILARWAPAS